MKYRTAFRWAALLALGAVLVSCSRTSAKLDNKDRKSAPDFALKDATGKLVKLSDYRGKVVLLNFWATWCGPCKIEIPWFMEFQQQYKDRDFAVLGVSLDDDGWQSVKPYVAEHKINYAVVVGDDDVSMKYGGVDSLPTTFVIDRSGRIASMHVGLVSKSVYQDEIVQLLQAPREGSGHSVSLNTPSSGLLALLQK